MAVVIIDPTFDILMWTPQASELWGLEPDQAEGRSLFHLDIGPPMEALAIRVQSLLAGQSACELLVLDAIHRLGQPIHCCITCTPLFGTVHDIQGAILLMEANETHG